MTTRSKRAKHKDLAERTIYLALEHYADSEGLEPVTWDRMEGAVVFILDGVKYHVRVSRRRDQQ